jgi:hypothetical protein
VSADGQLADTRDGSEHTSDKRSIRDWPPPKVRRAQIFDGGFTDSLSTVCLKVAWASPMIHLAQTPPLRAQLAHRDGARSDGPRNGPRGPSRVRSSGAVTAYSCSHVVLPVPMLRRCGDSRDSDGGALRVLRASSPTPNRRSEMGSDCWAGRSDTVRVHGRRENRCRLRRGCRR